MNITGGDIPHGCLGCNRVEVTTALVYRGINPAAFHEVPRPRHAWNDVTTCIECGRAWVFDRKELYNGGDKMRIVYDEPGLRIAHWRNIEVLYYTHTPTTDDITATVAHSQAILGRHPGGIVGMVLCTTDVGVPAPAVLSEASRAIRVLGPTVLRLAVIPDAPPGALGRTVMSALTKSVNVLAKSIKLQMHTDLSAAALSVQTLIHGAPNAAQIMAEINACRPAVPRGEAV